MEPTDQDITETSIRSRRERHLPRHLSDYEVGYEPQLQDEPPKALSHALERWANETRATSVRNERTHQSHSSRRQASEGRAPSEGIQEAILQENIQRLELEELKRQVLEDCNADLECQRLTTQAREAQRLQQEALEAREAIAKRLDRQRLLKRKEKEPHSFKSQRVRVHIAVHRLQGASALYRR
ncbi:hypothetical protein SKAU_G00279640 [Synaphobranchus kaupii]|uniref:Uncharacterized protein n=1 Tax=Synaphobranchus kaupii TaxID=118154 RepID=A0A9Q1EWR2_SYNKA|nr:hypothetical protein SKAU_G00279640 [Synaphobranchus kaupii]